jgi:hypothetical protein
LKDEAAAKGGFSVAAMDTVEHLHSWEGLERSQEKTEKPKMLQTGSFFAKAVRVEILGTSYGDIRTLPRCLARQQIGVAARRRVLRAGTTRGGSLSD